MTDDQSTTSNTGGAAGLDGYHYQAEVSVWLALHLLLATQRAEHLMLEPRSHEDLEVDVAETAPSALTGLLNTGKYPLIVQCKLRGTGPWSLTDLAKLAAHHGPNRPSARDRLAAGPARYLLVTSAGLEGRAGRVRMGDVDDWPSLALPASLGLPTGVDGRFGVLADVDFEKLEARTLRLLTERFRVPRPKLAACRAALWSQALAHMRRAGGGAWTRAEVAQVIRDHEGYLGATPSSDTFVPPNNWADIQTAVEQRNAVIIRGQSGSGKTRTAEALLEVVHGQLPDAVIHRVDGGPGQVRAAGPGGPAIFMIEDPWGKFRLSPSAEPWNDEIHNLLGTARADRRFIITSRADVLKESGPKRLPEFWFVDLEGENYGPQERRRLFDNGLAALPRSRHALAGGTRDHALSQLTTPLEIQRYFSLLADGPVGAEADGQFLARCLEEAELEGLETALLASIRRRGDWAWAAVVWGLFKGRSRISFNITPSVQRGLATADAALHDGLDPYLNFLVAGRHLRQSEAVLSLSHPRVEQGLELALDATPGESGTILGRLAEVLIGLDRPGDDWGVETAAGLLLAAVQRPRVYSYVDLQPDTQGALDAWLAARLAGAGDAFEEDLARSAALGSPQDPMAQLARWLTHRTSTRTFPPRPWSLPAGVDPTWYETLRADLRTGPICAAFVRRIVPFGHNGFPGGFAEHLRRLAPDIDAAFIAAADDIAAMGYLSNADIIISAALHDLDAFRPVVASAIAVLAGLGDSDDLWLAMANNEIDEDIASDVAESRGEDGHTAGRILSAYAAALRACEGWPALRDHPQASEILDRWIETLPPTPTEAEVSALAKATADTADEAAFWRRAHAGWPLAAQGVLLDRLSRAGLGSDLREGLAEASLAYLSPGDLAEAFDRWPDERGLEFVIDLRGLAARPGDQSAQCLINALLAEASGAKAEALSAVAGAGSIAAMSASALDWLSALPPQQDLAVNLRLAEAMASDRRGNAGLLDAVLADDGPPKEARIAAVSAAVDMAAALGQASLVDRALGHRFAAVRERALHHLADGTPGVLPDKVLALAEDRGRDVKLALLALLEARPAPEHQATIAKMVADSFETGSPRYGDDPAHPIAQAAARALAHGPPIDRSHVAGLRAVLQSTQDFILRRLIVEALLANGPPDLPQKVMKLALDRGRLKFHVAAAEALFQQTDHVTREIADQIDAAQLELRDPRVAIPLALVAGACATPDHVKRLAEALASNPKRRALIFALWLGDPEGPQAEAILDLFADDGLLATLNAFSAPDVLLPRDLLDPHGETEITERLVARFAGFFAPKPPTVAPTFPGVEDVDLE